MGGRRASAAVLKQREVRAFACMALFAFPILFTTKATKSTKESENEALDPGFQPRECPCTQRTVEFHPSCPFVLFVVKSVRRPQCEQTIRPPNHQSPISLTPPHTSTVMYFLGAFVPW